MTYILGSVKENKKNLGKMLFYKSHILISYSAEQNILGIYLLRSWYYEEKLGC